MERVPWERPDRETAAPVEETSSSRRPHPEAGLGFLVAALWLASAVRFGAALYRQESFGAGASLAGLTVLLVPWLIWRGRRSRE